MRFLFFLFFNITFSFQFKTYQVKTKKRGTLLHNSRQRETTQSKSSVFTFWCFEEIIWCCFFFKFLFDGIVSVHHHSSGAEPRSQWKPVEWYCYCFLIKLYLLYWCVFYWLWQHTQIGYCCLCISVPFLLLYRSQVLYIHTVMMGFSNQSTEQRDMGSAHGDTAELSQTVNWVLFCIRLKNCQKMI